MTQSSLKYVVIVILLLGGVLVASTSEGIRCRFELSCDAETAVVPAGEVELLASTTISIATTTTIVATTTPKASPAVPKRVTATTTAPKPPVASPQTVTIVTQVTTVTTPTPPPAEEGPTTFSVSAVPLLSGGNVRGGATVPISYLKIVNRGQYAARLQGFWLAQNGSAPTRTVIGLSTVDDKGGSRGQTGGVEGSTPFSSGAAFAPTDALFQPGQMKLFTVKATMTSDISAYVGTELKIDVTSLQAKDATFTGAFPIRGTTWTLSQ